MPYLFDLIVFCNGGDARSRTEVHGFASRGR